MRIFFRQQDHSDGCMSACIAMILDMDYHEVYIDIHDTYQKVTNEEDEYALIKEYIESKGIPVNQDFADDIEDGLYLIAVPMRATQSWHACLLTIYKDEAKIIDPRMLSGKRFVGFDEEESVSPVDVRPILKVEWEDYQKHHGDKIQ